MQVLQVVVTEWWSQRLSKVTAPVKILDPIIYVEVKGKLWFTLLRTGTAK